MQGADAGAKLAAAGTAAAAAPAAATPAASAAPASGPAPRLKVFISYSRKDQEFADELEGGLKLLGYDVFIDRQMSGGEAWKQSLMHHIAQADTIVFVLSPDSLDSEMCQEEVDHAAAMSKRILPVVIRDVGGAKVPERLRDLNYIFFTPPNSFVAKLGELRDALDKNLDWIREHTRYLELAMRWAAATPEQRPGRLLTGAADIAAAKMWLSQWQRPNPEPTETQRAFIAASEAHATAEADARQQAIAERERLAREAEAQARKAESEARRAAEAARAAEEAQQGRIAALAAAETAAKESARSQKRAGRLLWGVLALVLAMLGGTLWQARETDKREVLIYTSLAATAMNEDRHDRAMRFALQAYPPRDCVFCAPSPELEGRLAGAPTLTRLRATFRGHTNAVFRAVFSPDGKRVVTASSDQTARLWDAETGKEIAVLKAHEGGALAASWRRDGRRLVTAGVDNVARIWDVEMMTVYRVDLRERVCAEKLIGAQEFTDQELADPILRGIDASDPVARNPCLRRGPLSLDFWTRLPGQWWRWATR